jgi:DNA-binding MarR family transcriptional regulator
MPGFDEVIHQSTRLKIMAALMALSPGEMLDFPALVKALNLTDGNLGAHLLKLEEGGYIKIKKSFVDRKPRTHLELTTRGRSKFEEHVEALRAIIEN